MLNPADIPSRGMMPTKLKDCKLEWSDPDFRIKDKSLWPNPITSTEDLENEQKEENVESNRKKKIL